MNSPARMLLAPSIRSLQGYALFLGLLALGASLVAGYLTVLRTMALLLVGLALLIAACALAAAWVQQRGKGLALMGLFLSLAALLWAWQFPHWAGIPLADAPEEGPRLRPAVAAPIPAAPGGRIDAQSAGPGQLRGTEPSLQQGASEPAETAGLAALRQQIESLAESAAEPRELAEAASRLRHEAAASAEGAERERLESAVDAALASAVDNKAMPLLTEGANRLAAGNPEGAAEAANQALAMHRQAAAPPEAECHGRAQTLLEQATQLRQLRDNPAKRFTILGMRGGEGAYAAEVRDRFSSTRQTVRAGDRLGEWTVARVERGSVHLQGPGGRVRLER